MDNTTYIDARHPYLDAPITNKELLRNIKSLKNAKSPGLDMLGNEFYTSLPECGTKCVLELFNKILISEKTPASWSEVALTMIHKKGDKNEPLNYRGIALVNSITKLFTQILKKRLQSWAEGAEIIPESQAGLRAGRSCIDQVFVLTSAVHLQLRLGGRSVYGLFVDFKRASDSIPHAPLWAKLFLQGVNAKMLRIFKNVYDSATVR